MGIPNIVIFQGQAVSELCPDPQYESRDQKYAHSALYADYIFWKIAKLYGFKDQNILRYTHKADNIYISKQLVKMGSRWIPGTEFKVSLVHCMHSG